MPYFKIEITQANEVLTKLNSRWLEWYADNGRNPNDANTNAYCQLVEIDGFGYIIKDEITEQYITGEWPTVSELPIINDLIE